MPDDDTMLGQNLVDVRNEERRWRNEQLFTPPVKLTDRQQLVYDLTEHGPVTATTAGIVIHSAREQWCACDEEGPCEWADSNGRDVLEALRRKGLLRRDRHWVYRRVDGTGGSQGDFPVGF